MPKLGFSPEVWIRLIEDADRTEFDVIQDLQLIARSLFDYPGETL